MPNEIARSLDTAGLARFRRKVTALSAGGLFLDGFDLTVIAVAVPVLRKECSGASGRARGAGCCSWAPGSPWS